MGRLHVLLLATAGCASSVSDATAGSIVIAQFDTVAGTQSSLSAHFLQPAPQRRASCTELTDGPCRFLDCTLPPAPLPAYVERSAGDVTISGLTLDAGAVSLRFDTSLARYPQEAVPTHVFAAGTSLTVSAAGDFVPTFQGVTVQAPAAAEQLEPACPSLDCGVVSHATAMAVRWRSTSPGTVVVHILCTGRGSDVTCTAPAEAGSLTVPATVMSTLQVGALCALSLTTTHVTEVMAGDVPVRVEASNRARASGGTFTPE